MVIGLLKRKTKMEYAEKNIKINQVNGQVLAANCTLGNGFEYAFNLMGRGGILTVIDSRRAETDPVAVICNYTATTIDDIEATVEKAIRLYKSYQFIGIARNIDEFEDYFKKIA